jgi:hypothetical protein
MHTQHTPEPWYHNGHSQYPARAVWNTRGDGPIDEKEILICSQDATFNDNHPSEAETDANMKRITACVNALKGVSTAALDAGAVRKLVEAARNYTKPLDQRQPSAWRELLAALQPFKEMT